MKMLLVILPVLMAALAMGRTVFGAEANSVLLQSPDGRISVDFKLTAEGSPTYAILLEGKGLLPVSKLGLVRDDADFSKGLTLVSVGKPEAIEDTYELMTIKRRKNTYHANRRTFHLETADGKKLDIAFQLSNDGVAFRYAFPEQSAELRKLREEKTSFRFAPETKAWLQPLAVAKSGWSQTNPSYEEFYEKEIPVGTPSTLNAEWVYPALFRTGDTWMVVSETGMTRTYCGTHLSHLSPEGEYAVAFADGREKMGETGAAAVVTPESTLPWATPWRIIAIGSLKTVTESTLGTDVAEKAPVLTPEQAAAIKPGKASWSWPLLGDSQTTYDTQKRFIDYAAEMGWTYCLIDALWDRQIGEARIRELVKYGEEKKVGILLWYNSAGPWNTAPQTPRDKMLTHASRMSEFAKLREMGVKGVKVDFFGGDGQSVMNYYLDILDDATAHGLLVNFHGATLPRGWQRAYPYLMTMESIRGFEYATFEQRNADQQPTHCAMLPFTRNIFDPMDYTPVCLDRISNRIQRRTTSGFELALSVLFTSGIQHYAEIPEGMARMPVYVKDFMKHVPSIWDEIKFVDGYPGKFVVLARRGDGKWYLAGINGENAEKTLSLSLAELPGVTKGTIISDGAGQERFDQRPFTLGTDKKVEVTMKGHGGFVAVLE